MTTTSTKFTLHDGIATFTMARLPANALDLDFLQEMAERWEEMIAHAPRAIVLASEAKLFSAGLDLKAIPFYTNDEVAEMLRRMNRLLSRVYDSPAPLVAAINGHAIAGGLVVALCCDVRIAVAGGSKFGLTEAKVGVPFPIGVMEILKQELAPPDLRYLSLRCHHIGVEDAYRRGIVDEIVAPEELQAKAFSMAVELSQIPASAYVAVRRQQRSHVLKTLQDLISGQISDPLLETWYIQVRG